MRGYPGPGWGVAVSSPSSPAHSALQPAYSSPHVAEANIYAEVAEYEVVLQKVLSEGSAIRHYANQTARPL